MLKRKRVLSLTLIFCLALPLTVFGSSPGQAENGAFTEMRAWDGLCRFESRRGDERGGFVSMLAEASRRKICGSMRRRRIRFPMSGRMMRPFAGRMRNGWSMAMEAERFARRIV